MDFAVHTWDRQRTVPLRLQSHCRACRRMWRSEYYRGRRAGAAAGVVEDMAWLEAHRAKDAEAQLAVDRSRGARPVAELRAAGVRGGRPYVHVAADMSSMKSKMTYGGLLIGDGGPFFRWLDGVVKAEELDLRVVLGGTLGRYVSEARRTGRITEQLVDAVCVALSRPGAYEEIVGGGSAPFSG